MIVKNFIKECYPSFTKQQISQAVENMHKKILRLTLKGIWYDMIAAGTKTEEYREIKPYWEKRLLDYKALSDYVDKNYVSLLVYQFIVHGNIQPHIDGCKMFPRGYLVVTFSRGYGVNMPHMSFVLQSITMGQGKTEWGAPAETPVFIIKLGKRLDYVLY